MHSFIEGKSDFINHSIVQVALPSFKTMELIANALNVKLKDFFVFPNRHTDEEKKKF